MHTHTAGCLRTVGERLATGSTSRIFTCSSSPEALATSARSAFVDEHDFEVFGEYLENLSSFVRAEQLCWVEGIGLEPSKEPGYVGYGLIKAPKDLGHLRTVVQQRLTSASPFARTPSGLHHSRPRIHDNRALGRSQDEFAVA